jgi:hypothetical protein
MTWDIHEMRDNVHTFIYTELDTSLLFSECQWGQPGQCRTNSGEFSEPGYELGQLVAEEEMYKYM